MFDFSFTEILLVAVVGVLLIGPQEMPAVAKGIVRLMRSWRRLVSEVRAGFSELTDDEQLREFKSDIVREKRYLMDESGKLQEIYDISEFITEETVKHKGNDSNPSPRAREDDGALP